MHKEEGTAGTKPGRKKKEKYPMASAETGKIAYGRVLLWKISNEERLLCFTIWVKRNFVQDK